MSSDERKSRGGDRRRRGASSAQGRDALRTELPYVLAIAGILLTVGLSFAAERPTQLQYFVLRVVLALAGAGAAAVIPGLLKVELSRGIRAGGALAIFVVIYFANPPAPPSLEGEAGAGRAEGRPAVLSPATGVGGSGEVSKGASPKPVLEAEVRP